MRKIKEILANELHSVLLDYALTRPCSPRLSAWVDRLDLWRLKVVR